MPTKHPLEPLVQGKDGDGTNGVRPPPDNKQPNMNTRKQIREHMRQQRDLLSHAERTVAASQLFRHVSTSSLFKNSQRIAFYLPNNGEIDITPLIQLAWQYNKRCYLPVLGLRNSRKMWFTPYQPGSILLNNRFGIPEPVHPKHARLFKAQSLDMILVPLVAFDKQGHRLGMGGGFYDRTLQFLLHRQQWKRPCLIGTGYAFQQVEQLEDQQWDVPLQAIATEQGLQFV